MNYVEVAIPFFILAMAIEFLYGLLVRKQTYRLNDTVNSLQLGVLSRLVDILRLSFAAVVLGTLVQWLGVPQWPMDAAWQWAAAFVVYDFCYYWKHRFGHEWRILWARKAKDRECMLVRLRAWVVGATPLRRHLVQPSSCSCLTQQAPVAAFGSVLKDRCRSASARCRRSTP